MIYLLSIRDRERDEKGRWYHKESPRAQIINIQRPFIHLSTGPMIDEKDLENSIDKYRRWMFDKLLNHYAAKEEFTKLLDILIQEGELILQCSCRQDSPVCHGRIIKNALRWAEPIGILEWHNQLKAIVSKQDTKI